MWLWGGENLTIEIDGASGPNPKGTRIGRRNTDWEWYMPLSPSTGNGVIVLPSK